MSVPRRPRILLVLDDERDFSGPSIVLFRLFKELVARGLVELRVISQKSPAIEAALEKTGFDHHFHDFPLTYSRQNLPFMGRSHEVGARKRAYVMEQARYWRADLVHIAVHPLGPLLAPALSQEAVPCLVHFHANHALPRVTPYRFSFRHCLTRPGVHALAVSDWTAANVTTLGVPSSRITRLYNGIPPPQLTPTPERGLEPQATGPVLAFIAQIRPEKGLEHFLQALAMLARTRGPTAPSPVTGVIIGRSFDPSYLERCREKAKALMRQTGSGLIFDFAGFKPDPFDLSCGWDGVVLPSLFDDPLPTVAIESVCRGIPTIGYARGGLREILGEGRGTPVEKTMPAELAQALTLTLAEDSTKCRASRRANSLRLFSIDTMVEAYLAQVAALFSSSERAEKVVCGHPYSFQVSLGLEL